MRASSPDDDVAGPMRYELPLSAVSRRYRARAEECRLQALLFRDENAQAQMLQSAADYDRKAAQAEAFEVKEPKA